MVFGHEKIEKQEDTARLGITVFGCLLYKNYTPKASGFEHAGALFRWEQERRPLGYEPMAGWYSP